MKRRNVLAALGGACAVGAAGCLQASSPLANDTRTDGHSGTDASGSTPPSMPPADSCPPVVFEDGRTRCQEEADDWGVRMTGDPTTLSMPRDDCEIVLENTGDTTLSSNADGFTFYAWRDGQWQFVLQRMDELALEGVEIPPGETRTWSVTENTADLGELTPPNSGNDDEQDFTLRFPPGSYAFGYRVSRGSGELSTETSRPSRTYATRFSVGGDPLALEPSDAMTETLTRDGSHVVRTQTEYEYDHSRKVSLRMERLDAVPGQAAPVTTFELYNPGFELVDSPDRTFVDLQLVPLLRDAFATAPGDADAVRVETVDTATPPLGLNGPLGVVYDGTPWRLTATEGWGG